MGFELVGRMERGFYGKREREREREREGGGRNGTARERQRNVVEYETYSEGYMSQRVGSALTVLC